jgi:hypothetical protein
VKFPRFSIRGIMIIVALVALLMGGVLWLQERRERLRLISIRHAMQWAEMERAERTEALGTYHRAMWIKYRSASHRPWMPVEPDPPEPE